jgi:hypothetical protein
MRCSPGGGDNDLYTQSSGFLTKQTRFFRRSMRRNYVDLIFYAQFGECIQARLNGFAVGFGTHHHGYKGHDSPR